MSAGLSLHPCEATVIGHGEITRVAAASGTSTSTIARGIAELAGCSVPTLRIRAPGAGRKRLTDTDSGLLPALKSLIEPHTRGDPVAPLREPVQIRTPSV